MSLLAALDLPKDSDRCQCGGCGELFNSTSMFDRHRIGQPGKSRRCLSPAEMVAKGYSLNNRGSWIRSRMPVQAGTVAHGAATGKPETGGSENQKPGFNRLVPA